MGIFKCSSCGCDYFDKRFIWEEELKDAAVKEVVADADVHRLGCVVAFSNRTISHVEKGSWAEAAGIEVGSKIIAVNGCSPGDLGTDELTALLRTKPLRLKLSCLMELQDTANQPSPRLCGSASSFPKKSSKTSSGSSTSSCESTASETEDDEMPADAGTQRRASVGPYADTMRAMGTAANVTGSLAPAFAQVVAPVSAVGGICGTVGGMYQLAEGLSTPSGKVDPHLVAKGSVTASVGTVCATLGVCAATAPVLAGPLLLAAFGLGLAGLSTATALDANMAGLCQDCRGRCHEKTDNECGLLLQSALLLDEHDRNSDASSDDEVEEPTEVNRTHILQSALASTQ